MLSSFSKCVTLETGGSRLSQWEEDVAHDGGTADTRGSDDSEDVVHVVTQVLLKRAAELGASVRSLTTNTNSHIIKASPLTLFVSRFSDSLSLTGSISQGLWSVQIYGESQNSENIQARLSHLMKLECCDVPHLWWAWGWPAGSASPPVSSSHRCTWKSVSFLGKWCWGPYAAERNARGYSVTE